MPAQVIMLLASIRLHPSISSKKNTEKATWFRNFPCFTWMKKNLGRTLFPPSGTTTCSIYTLCILGRNQKEAYCAEAPSLSLLARMENWRLRYICVRLYWIMLNRDRAASCAAAASEAFASAATQRRRRRSWGGRGGEYNSLVRRLRGVPLKKLLLYLLSSKGTTFTV